MHSGVGSISQIMVRSSKLSGLTSSRHTQTLLQHCPVTKVFFLHRWPSQRSLKRVRQRVKELTGSNRGGVKDVRVIIRDINPVLRGWGNYFRTGNAAVKFNQVDTYVWRPRASPPAWDHQVPGGCVMQRLERPSVSRVREIRTHGLNGVLSFLAR